MNLYHIPTDREAPLNPNAVPPYKGMSWDRPADRARFVGAGYRAIEFPNPPPQGAVCEPPVYTPKVGSDDTVIKSVAWITPEEAEALRIAKLAQDYGQLVGAFAQYLAVFGLAMPITEAAAEDAVYSGTEADGKKDPDAMRLMNLYGKLSKSLSDADIYAVSKVIGVAV